MNSKTLDYYNQNAESFVKGTVSVDFRKTQDRFMGALKGKKVLDFGCGSGRDTKYFLQAGLDVAATDGSEELCRIASEYTGIPVRKMLFQELADKNCYDGIWACSSILHLPKEELKDVFFRMSDALRMMILASPGQHSCNTRTHIPTTFGQAFLYYPDIHS